jgi:GntR family transcriptional regulator
MGIRGGEPFYGQVADAIRADIREGRYPPGTQLPTIQELRERFKVSDTTIRAALVQLRSEGLTVSYQGRGVFVREDRPPRRKLGHDASWRAILDRWGLADASVITVRRQPAPEDVAERLGLPPGTEVLVRDRLLRAEGEPPTLISLSWHPLAIVERIPDLEDPAKGGMKGMHEALGMRLYFEDVYSARRPTDAERERLQLDPGDVVLVERGTTFDQDGQPLYAIDHIAAGHRYEHAVRYGDVPDETG